MAFLSDSMSVLKALHNPVSKSDINPLILDIKRVAYEILNSDNIELKLVWVPSHVGIQGNEVVDAVAGSPLIGVLWRNQIRLFGLT